jgi:hypothetical protein
METPLPIPVPPGAVRGVAEWLSVLLQLATAISLAWGLIIGIRRILGRRWTLMALLRRLVAGGRIEYFEEVLGQAAFRRPYGEVGTSYTWVEPEVYVQAFVRDDFVRVYTVTTRRRWFRPTLGNFVGAPPGRVQVGKTTFGDLPYEDPGTVSAFVGARRHGYAEIHYYGNPGGYRQFAFAINDAGVFYDDDYVELCHAGEKLALSKNDDGEYDSESLVRVKNLRRSMRFNTYAVSEPHGNIADAVVDMPVIGANLDEVRVMEDYVSPPRRLLLRYKWGRTDRKWGRRQSSVSSEESDAAHRPGC